MLYTNLYRLLTSAPRKYSFYLKATQSIDFMRRYTLLGILYIINAMLGGMIKKGIDKIHPILHKEFVFHTPFGIYMGSTVNQWTVLAPDYEPLIQKVIRKCTEKTPIPERVLVNIGTHIGRYAIELVKNHHYTAYCFEPNPPTFKVLQINTLLSSVDSRCFLFPYALGHSNTIVGFEHIEYNDGSSRIILGDEPSTHPKKHITYVPVKSFDTLHSHIDPSLILIDVEGFEYQVVQGMQQSLARYKQVDIIMEIFSHSPTKEKVLQTMEELGYQYAYIDKDNIHFWKI